VTAACEGRGHFFAERRVVRRVIAAPAKKCGKRYSSREHRGADKRPQALTRAADQISPRQDVNSWEAHEMDGLTPVLGSGPLNQEDFLKFYSSWGL
jgi:hypothetical protein